MVSKMRKTNPLAALALVAALPALSMGGDPVVEIHGAGWLQAGKIEKSSVSGNVNDYNKTWFRNAGGVFGASAKFDDNWDGGFGLGTINVHLTRGQTTGANIWYPFWVPFVTEARVTRTSIFAEDHKLALTIGAFPVNYNPDVKNLGLYLMHGYVYPGALVSAYTGPLGVLAATTGAMASYQIGRFQDNLILISETDDHPLYDFSLADIATFKPIPGIELGAGVNLYRLIAQDKRQTSPGKDCIASSELGEYSKGCFELDSVGVLSDGTIVNDTVTGSLAGTKLMARFHLDPKAIFGFQGPLGPGDLIIYGEAAVLGVKNQGKYYDDIKQRVPVMVGFNFPTFRILDNLSLEAEYYASKNSSDNIAAQYGSWVPSVHEDVNNKRDDWKWSLNIDKVLLGHIKISGQLANDHLRLGGFHNLATGVETTTTPKDYYWTTKVVYFF